MKDLEYYINILHYIIYKGDYKLHKLFEKVNPFMLLHRLPFQRRKYEKEGIDIYKEMDAAFKDPVAGISSIRSGGNIGLLFVMMGGSLFIITDKIFNDHLDDLLMFVFVLPFGLLIYYTVLYKGKYLTYFKEFDKKSIEVTRKWARACLAVIIGIILLLLFSFWI